MFTCMWHEDLRSIATAVELMTTPAFRTPHVRTAIDLELECRLTSKLREPGVLAARSCICMQASAPSIATRRHQMTSFSSQASIPRVHVRRDLVLVIMSLIAIYSSRQQWQSVDR
jgi:hypothetical protein